MKRRLVRHLVHLSVCLLPWLAAPAHALESFDFETPYLVHPGQQVWDFSLIHDSGQYHAFYHTIPQDVGHPAAADTIWHAVSPDLNHWEILGPALTAGPDWYDDVAMWAPDVVYDETTNRWAMLYTGVAQGMVQRACLAWSDDLATWQKSLSNPVFAPDTLTYFWGPDDAWSSFRDPFIYHDGEQWNMLSTAALRLGGYPGYRRGIVHRAVSPDLENWQDGGVFYEHNGTLGRSRDLESVQYLVRDGWHHLFFVEQDLAIDNHPVHHMVAADPAGWNMDDRDHVDAGWAPEIKPFASGTGDEIFARLAKDKDPRNDTWFVTIRFDTLRFNNGGQTPEVIFTDPLVDDWPTRTGLAAMATPTFDENPIWRGDPTLGNEGHGWFSSFEHYGGPLAGVGLPGAALGDTVTGRLESRSFTVTGGHLRLLLAGGTSSADCYVALLDDDTGTELSRLYADNSVVLTEHLWNLGPWLGRTVRLAVVDDDTGPGGWLAVDGIEERLGGLAGVGPVNSPPGDLVTGLRAWPNPFNPRTTIRFDLVRSGRCRVDIYDLAGKRVWQSGLVAATTGEIRFVWDGRDGTGRPLGSGVFLAQILVDGSPAGSLRLILLK